MKRTTKFTSVFGENWVTGRYLIPKLIEQGKDQRGILLDLACGESPFREYFPKVDKYHRVDRSSLDEEVVEGDMLAIPHDNNSFDIVLLFQAITDVPNPVDVLMEVKRVLKPKGKLLVFESMAYPEHDMPYDYYRLMPEGLNVLVKETGMQVHEINRLGGLFTRFSSLWATFIMGKLKAYSLLKPLSFTGIACGNLLCYSLDRLIMHPRLASDYLAIITYKDK